MKASDRLGLAVMAALLLALPLLRPVTEDSRLFAWGGFAIVANALVGVVGRRARLVEGAVHLLQIAFGLGFLVFLLWQARPGTGLPTAFSQVIEDAVRWVRLSAAPMPPNTSVALVGAWALWMLAVLADMLVVTLGRPAMIAGPLLGLYAVPALAIPTPVAWPGYLAFCLGVALVLLADAANRTAVLRSAGLETSTHRRSLLAGGAAVLAAAAVGAMAVTVVVPVPESGTWAPLQGRGPITMSDPSLDLKRNLEQPEDRRVLSYTSDDGKGRYLRLATLTRMDARGWQLDQLSLYDGSLPRPPGFLGTGVEHRTRIVIDQFTSQWLPLPYAPVSFTASGDWRHDTQSLVVLWGGPQAPNLVNTAYDVVSNDVTPEPGAVRRARAGLPADDGATLRLPADLPPEVARLAAEVVDEATTDGERAIALQNWFRSNAFTYSTESASGSGYAALTQFLFDDRTGYCEQFAGSMAIMARTLHIPARVAIGFLPGKPVAGGRHEVSVRDMHAWPELYFEGLGWVSFEPTPGVSGSPPPFTGASASPSASATSRTATPSASQATASSSPTPVAPVGGDDSGRWQDVLGAAAPWLGGGLAVAAIAALPWAIRTLRRRRRAALTAPDDRVEAAWDEVRDAVWDTGAQWPAGSPRTIGGRLAGLLDEGSGAAVRELATWVERNRYDRALAEVPDLSPAVTAIGQGLWGRPRLRRRTLRRLFPLSVWRGLSWRP